MKYYPGLLFSFFVAVSCHQNNSRGVSTDPYLIVLGIAQDAGYPQAGCDKECCTLYWQGKEKRKTVTSLGLVIPEEKKLFLFEATPDFTSQWNTLKETSNLKGKTIPDGIFLTHAHIGHYTGLMYLGKEAMGAENIPVFAMPRMKKFLEDNGPWNQLVDLGNIRIQSLAVDSFVQVSQSIRITPFLVPHRDEYSETVGYKIESGTKKILFIPDIDKWQKWQQNIVEVVKQADMALLDATFFGDGEISRNMHEVPHPFVSETMALFDSLPATEKNKIVFIHFNHTNPLLRNTPERQETKRKGYRVAFENMKIVL